MAEGIKIENQFLGPELSPFKSETYFLFLRSFVSKTFLSCLMECSGGGEETEEHSAPDISIIQVDVDKTCKFSVCSGLILLRYFLSLFQYVFQDPFAFSEQHSACSGILHSHNQAPLTYLLSAAERMLTNIR